MARGTDHDVVIVGSGAAGAWRLGISREKAPRC